MTAELEKPAPPPPVKDNPFKKVSRHYARLIIITLCICAAVLIPAATVFKLYINEENDLGTSFSSLKVDREMKNFGDMLKRGEYRKALDSIYLYYQEDYTKEELAVFKDMFAEDLKVYFEKYPIRKVDPQANKGKSKGGELYLHLKGDFGDLGEGMMMLSFSFNETDDGTKRLCYTGGWGYTGRDSSEYAEYSKDLNASFPPMTLISSETAEYLLEGLNSDNKRPLFFTRFFTEEMETLGNEISENGAYKVEELAWVYMQKLGKLNENYSFTDCTGGKVTYEHGKLFNREVYFLQHTVLNVKEADGGEFTVEFDLPTYDGYSFTHLKNVTYSPGAPEDFKKRFEEIFVSKAEIYSQFEIPKLNDGKFYLNGDTESCCIEVRDGKIKLSAETDKQLRDMYEALCSINENTAQNWSYEDWRDSFLAGDIYGTWSEPGEYRIFASYTGTRIAFNVQRGDDGRSYGSMLMDYIDENTISVYGGTYIRIE